MRIPPHKRFVGVRASGAISIQSVQSSRLNPLSHLRPIATTLPPTHRMHIHPLRANTHLPHNPRSPINRHTINRNRYHFLPTNKPTRRNRRNHLAITMCVGGG
ncbi:Uncharacterised protein [Actinomyces bovis]|uniref:Uncharacterized protein n=1 Tax=Actinomyces bovis TaxID=1658 RepID=A0ABY1VPG9_9ACTO|nr:Uncharacterised protein [Actinomyces bovis]VEG55665.1 Uncharacterised protein [Actinomyces israelii]